MERERAGARPAAPRPLDRAGAERYAAWFRALGDPTRVQMLSVLAHGGGSLPAGEIAAATGVSQPTVSQHLKVLADVGFVLGERRGTAHCYRINQACVAAFPSAADLVVGATPPPATPGPATLTSAGPGGAGSGSPPGSRPHGRGPEGGTGSGQPGGFGVRDMRPADAAAVLAIYQAGPLSTEAERQLHRTLSARLREAGHTVVWLGDLLTPAQIDDAGHHAPMLIFTTCRDAIEGCACIVALLDGTQVDDGTAWAVGYAYANGIPVYGYRTDYRRAGETPHSCVASMIQGSLTGFARNIEDLVSLLADESNPRYSRRIRDRRREGEGEQVLWKPVTPQLDSLLLDTRTEGGSWPEERRRHDRRSSTTVRDDAGRPGDSEP